MCALRILVLLWAMTPMAQANPPLLKIPDEVIAKEQYVKLTPDTDAQGVVYIGLSGIDAFPSEELKDPRRFLLDTRGLPEGRYRFAAIGASATGEQTRVDFTVIVGGEPAGDPLLAAFKKALERDPSPTKLADVKALASAYRNVAKELRGASNPLTAGDFATLVVRLRKDAIADRLDSPRDLFGEQVAQLNLPDSPTAVLTPEQKSAAAKLFSRFATVLEAIR